MVAAMFVASCKLTGCADKIIMLRVPLELQHPLRITVKFMQDRRPTRRG